MSDSNSIHENDSNPVDEQGAASALFEQFEMSTFSVSINADESTAYDGSLLSEYTPQSIDSYMVQPAIWEEPIHCNPVSQNDVHEEATSVVTPQESVQVEDVAVAESVPQAVETVPASDPIELISAPESLAPESSTPESAPLGEPHEILASLISPKKKKAASTEIVASSIDTVAITAVATTDAAATAGTESNDSAGEPAPVLSNKKLKKLRKLAAAAEREAAGHVPIAPLAVTKVAKGSDSPTTERLRVDRKVVESAPAERRHSEPVDGKNRSARMESKPETRVKQVVAEVEIAEDEADALPRFADLPLSAEVLAAVKASGYETPTPIQSEIIPHMLAGRDLLAQSQTGTGKTAAFALPILSNIDLNSQSVPKALVLAPTRELAIQVAKSFETYAENMRGFNVVAIYGGQDYEIQFRQLRRGAHVVVGTPGRVIDHINRGTLDLSGIETLVLDEADEMLNMGFLEDVQFVLDQTPENRQIALFSATLPGPVRSIAERYLSDPVKITIKKKTMTADSIRQRALFVSPREKMDVLCRFLEIEETDGVIIFTKTKDATVSVAEALNQEGLSAIALNGDMPQKVRERAIDQLKSGRLNILVATDVAARGLDVKRISHVFNFDLPHDSESYIHRVGRTGRAGRAGEAIIFLTPAQRGKLRLIENATKQSIEVVQPPTADDVNAARIARFKERITRVTAERDLTIYKDLVAKYAEETGKPLELIAAALADISQQGRPFLVRDQPKRGKRDQGSTFERDDRRPNRNEGFGDGEAPRRGKPAGRTIGPPEPGMQRYRVEVGHRDGVRPGNIVGAIANEAGIGGEFIGPIKILDAFSTIDLPKDLPRELVQTLRNTWVVGKQLRISHFSAEGEGGHQVGEGSGVRGGSPGKFGHSKASKPKSYEGSSRKPVGAGYAKPGKPGKPKKRKNKFE